jgi:hypothetical protein
MAGLGPAMPRAAAADGTAPRLTPPLHDLCVHRGPVVAAQVEMPLALMMMAAQMVASAVA